MERKMFGHRLKKRSDNGRVPGQPYSNTDYDEGNEKEDSYKYVKSKDFPNREIPSGKDKDGPPGYEGKEHVKFKDPGYSSHNIRYPEDEPHMKSHVDDNEKHEMEDNFHQDVPDQTEYSLEQKIKRARMKMDDPDQEEPDKLRGNMVHNVPYEGELDTTGEEEMGPNDMQSDRMPKSHRKRLITAVIKKKMNKKSY